jgi:DNA-binding CsgD family transcriptional regulator
MRGTKRVLAKQRRKAIRRAMLVADIEGKLYFADPAARRWLRQFFGKPTRSGKLPRKVARWISRARKRKCNCSLIAKSDSAKLHLRREPSYADNKIVLLFELIKNNQECSRSHQTLTPREREVLFWLARGNSNAKIGAILAITASTVGKHLERIYPKLGVGNRTEASSLCLDR